MDVSQTSEHIAQDSLDVSMDTFSNMVQILNALGNDDSLAIFMYTANGIKSSKQAIFDLGLTQKRFYSRLKDLIDVGFIEKDSGTYRHTSLGTIFYKMGLSLMSILENKERITLLDQLKQTMSLSSSDLDTIKSMVSQGSSDISGVLDLVFFSNKKEKIEMLPTYDKLVEKLVTEMSGVKRTILLASRYVDNRVIDSLLKVANKGVEFKVIMAKHDLEDKMNKLQMILSPKLVMSMIEYFSSPDIDDRMRDGEIPFSFCIIDDTHCFFELPSLGESSFSIAFFLSDKDIGTRFSAYYDALWEMSEKKSMPKLFQQLSKFRQ